MIQFFKTLIAGIKEGAIAAWYDLRWYICIIAIVLVVYLAFKVLKKIIRRG
jgi:t-SNARE complex subunit (syntaxin)